MSDAKQKTEGTKLDRATAKILQDIEKAKADLRDKGALVVFPKLFEQRVKDYEEVLKMAVEAIPSNGVESEARKLAIKREFMKVRAKHEKQVETLDYLAYDALDMQLNASRQIPAKTE